MDATMMLAAAAGGGFVVGALIIGLIMAVMPLKRVRSALEVEVSRVAQTQLECDNIERQLGTERDQWRKEKNQLGQQLTRTQEELRERQRELSRLEKKFTDAQTAWDAEREHRIKQVDDLKVHFEKAKHAVATTDKRIEQEVAKWKRELVNVSREKQQIQAQLLHFQQERKAEVAAKLDEHRDAWEQENMDLRVQISQLQADRASFEQKATNVQHIADQERRAFEDTLSQLKSKSEQEKQALEEEIGQLMERLMRLQRKA